MCVCLRVLLCVCGGRGWCWVSSSAVLAPHFLRQSLTKPGAPRLGRLADQDTTGIFLSLPPQDLDHRLCHPRTSSCVGPCLLFCWLGFLFTATDIRFLTPVQLYVGSGDLNSGLRACSLSAFCPEPSSQSPKAFSSAFGLCTSQKAELIPARSFLCKGHQSQMSSCLIGSDVSKRGCYGVETETLPLREKIPLWIERIFW